MFTAHRLFSLLIVMSVILNDIVYSEELSNVAESWRQSLRQRREQQNGANKFTMDFNTPDAQWDLHGCCNGRHEMSFLAFYGGYIVVFFLLYSTTLLKPMRLLAVFIHEFGHASVCWMTGGSVKTIEVYGNEGGVTSYTGGCRYVCLYVCM
jgi:Peptidase M50B-like